MATIHLSPDAEGDLDEILENLDVRTPAAAVRLASAIRRKVELLASFPESGRIHPDIGEGYRSSLVSPYLIFYRIDQDVVEILRIVHGSRDLNKLKGLGGPP